MAPSRNSHKCGSCPKFVTSKTGGIQCQGNCKLWFHFECAGKSSSEYSFTAGEESNFTCDKCGKKSDEVMSITVSKSSENSVEINDRDDCRQCSLHINILTDQIFELSKNQSEMRKQLTQLQKENVNLIAKLNEVGLLVDTSLISQEKQDSYADKLKQNPIDLETISPCASETEMADGGEPQPNKDEFIEVENRKRKHNRRFNKNNSGFIIGRANSDETLKIVDKLRYLFVSRVGENVDSDSLKQYPKKKAEGNYVITKLKNKRPGYSSYKVGVPISLWEKIFSPDFWPSGAFVNRFRYYRTNSSTRRDSSFLEQDQYVEPKS
ncbi:hypothetical protein J6590_046753 [Homalodisca vitripennis]|nr:hypothetical protein J6590_046753 [Homalodisca vitripennis]